MNMRHLRSALTPAAAGVVLVALLGANPANADDGHRHRFCDHPPGHAYGHFKQHHAMKHDSHVVRAYRGYAYNPPRQRVVYRQTYYGGGHATQTPNFGNAVGGALGGYIGSQIGSGSGQLAATAAGAIAGYVIGGSVVNGRY